MIDPVLKVGDFCINAWLSTSASEVVRNEMVGMLNVAADANETLSCPRFAVFSYKNTPVVKAF